MQILEGKPYPLGAAWDGLGTNFAIFSEHADRVELCFFDSVEARREQERIELPGYNNFVWHGYIPNIGLVSFMRIESTDRGSPKKGCASTTESWLSILMPSRLSVT